ncbi:MAG: rhodanese-like domain-containing protein [Gammaproteobacteria bacterium]|nr:rhodanese-like domain-containing protein [Gammaproteobacteria bacterium]MDH5659789.1 rhodanese-like domain-containing protein [Gammaproteobacteria bacterium]
MTSASVKTISAKDAHQLLEKDPRALLVDVRSNMEFLFIGHPVGAISIPWIDEPDWVINPNFAAEVRKLLLGGLDHNSHGHNVPVLLICRSGKRSLEAGKLLLKEGFHDVYNIEDGFEGELDEDHHRSTLAGWRFEGLPWNQC